MSKLTAKGACSIIPKWRENETISDYCNRVRDAWEYCKDESFEEDKFCRILKLYLPGNAHQLVKSLETSAQLKVESILTQLMNGLGRRTHEYLQELSTTRKDSNETHIAFAQRILRLYQQGTGSTGALTENDKKLIVDFFLRGLPANEEASLRLVASDTEMTDVQLLAKRASRSRNPVIVNAILDRFDPYEPFETSKLF